MPLPVSQLPVEKMLKNTFFLLLIDADFWGKGLTPGMSF